MVVKFIPAGSVIVTDCEALHPEISVVVTVYVPATMFESAADVEPLFHK